MAAAYSRSSTARIEERITERIPDIHPIREQRKKSRGSIRVGISSVIILMLGFVLMIGATLMFIRTQNTLTMSKTQYASKLSQYEELKRSNDLYEERIISRVDMEEVARIAEEELGMQRASEGQIISYSGQIDDYVKQYADVPALD